MRLQDFKDGKIAVWAETKAEAQRFLDACDKAGLLVKSDVPKRARVEYVCGWTWHFATWVGYAEARGYAQKNAPIGKPYKSITVAEFFKDKRNEQVIAYYNPDGSVTCVHKKDGKIVESATVKRYYTDPDDLRVAAKHALEKMLGETKPVAAKDYNAIVDRRVECGAFEHAPYRTAANGRPTLDLNRAIQILDAWDAAHPVQPPKPVRPKPAEYRVGDKVVVFRESHGGDRQEGKIESDDGCGVYRYNVRLSNGRLDCFAKNERATTGEIFRDYIIGLVESPAPVTYKAGDLVRVRDDLMVGRSYGLPWLYGMDTYKGKVVLLKGWTGTNWNTATPNGWIMSEQMFSGLVTPTPPFDKDGKPNYKVGQKVRMRKGWETGNPFVGEITYRSKFKDGQTYEVCEPHRGAWWQCDRDIIGLADETPEE